MSKHFVRFLVVMAGVVAACAQTDWKAGAAKAAITPREPIRMAGFGFRNQPSEGVRQDIFVRALALRDESANTFVLATLDLAWHRAPNVG